MSIDDVLLSTPSFHSHTHIPVTYEYLSDTVLLFLYQCTVHAQNYCIFYVVLSACHLKVFFTIRLTILVSVSCVLNNVVSFQT